jgi:signal transduction histidine kinase
MMIGWLLTLGLSVAIMMLLPPPPSADVYRLSEIAGALRGGAVATRDGRPLRRAQAEDPPVKGEPRLTSGIYRLALATALKVPPTRIRFERYPIADPIERALVRALLVTPSPTAVVPGVLPAPAYNYIQTFSSAPAAAVSPRASPGAVLPPPPAFSPSSFRAVPLDSFPPVVGEFSAAVEDPSGAWTVVRPAPQVFPNAWHQRIILWLILCVGILTPIGYLFARRLTAPLGRFAQAAEQLGRDPSGPAMELSGPAEIGRAAAAFNDMQDRLRRYVEHRTSMIGAMAHDLRTPLARIRFKIEALPPEAKAPVARDIAQMEQMISAALAFVRGASERRPRELLDLSSVVQCVVDSAALLDADVRLLNSPALVIFADSLAIERLFANLIDNAVKYGRRARVKAHRDGESAIVEVSDSGRGIPAAELERVFEPFYRIEPSRSAETGGMGLGLSVARSIARSHGGDIELLNRRGLIARVRLPLARDGDAQSQAPSPAAEMA